ncbi:hypothetical protein ACET3Z_032265 [Daucus carota]
MAEAAGNWIFSSRSMNIIPKSLYPKEAKTLQLLGQPSSTKASIKKDQFPPISKKNQQRIPRHLIKISTAEGRWQGKWNSEYNLSLRDLQLQDLAEDGNGEAKVSISLCVDKHAGFGLSVDGRISTSFTSICCNCSLPYCREIDTNFNVWVLPSSRDNSSSIPEIGGDDPSLSLRALFYTHTHAEMHDT